MIMKYKLYMTVCDEILAHFANSVRMRQYATDTLDKNKSTNMYCTPLDI